MYIRDFGNFLYLCNKDLKKDVLLSESSRYFLKDIPCDGVDEQVLLDCVLMKFKNCFADKIKYDFVHLFSFLQEEGFLNSEYLWYISSSKYKGATSFSPSNMLDTFLKKRPMLLRLQIELTTFCNEKCIHCFLPKDRHCSHMSVELFKKIVDQFVEIGGIEITLTGGECLVHPEFFELYEYAAKKNLYISILSNLIFLTPKHIDLFKRYEVGMIQTSLYSLQDEVHDLITQIPGSAQKTKQSIDLLVKSGIYPVISCPIMRENKNS